jgi:hypothetical protein
MKSSLLLLSTVLAYVNIARAALEQVTPPMQTPEWQLGEIGPNHRVWKTETTVTNDDGTVRTETRSFVELASGLYYWRDKPMERIEGRN